MSFLIRTTILARERFFDPLIKNYQITISYDISYFGLNKVQK